MDVKGQEITVPRNFHLKECRYCRTFSWVMVAWQSCSFCSREEPHHLNQIEQALAFPDTYTGRDIRTTDRRWW